MTYWAVTYLVYPENERDKAYRTDSRLKAWFVAQGYGWREWYYAIRSLSLRDYPRRICTERNVYRVVGS
jgi:hypothetical protein